jgi:Amt family ammonium transporter
MPLDLLAVDPFDFTTVDAGATAWVMSAAAMVMLATAGVAFFYSGRVRAKHVLSMLMQNFTVIAVVSLLWMAIGYTLAFGGGSRLIGNLHFAGLQGMDERVPGFFGTHALVIPPLAFAAFQMMIAVITPALITGATADRWKFSSFIVFIAVWSLLVYAPVAHWVFSPIGWLARRGVLDFAGGTVVHINAGAAALAMVLVLGRRRGWPRDVMRPHNMPLALIGMALLWFGWFGLDAGSALRADDIAAYALVNTNMAAAAGMLAWTAVERLRFGRPSTLGAASGVVVGLVAVTPGAGYVSPLGAALVGVIAGVGCALAVTAKVWLRLDDSVDVVAVHLIGGVIGVLAVGLFASTAVNRLGGDGAFYGGGYALLSHQALAVVVVGGYSFLLTYVLGSVIDRMVGARVDPRQEREGLDISLHGESAYESDGARVSDRS